MNSDETPAEAMYRELREETGLQPHQVELLHATPGWLRYRLPSRCVRAGERLRCIGQKQVWFLLRMLCEDSEVRFDTCEKPEFDRFRWVDYWYPVENVVHFKREVYTLALSHVASAARGLAGRRRCPSAPSCGRRMAERRGRADRPECRLHRSAPPLNGLGRARGSA